MKHISAMYSFYYELKNSSFQLGLIMSSGKHPLFEKLNLYDEIIYLDEHIKIHFDSANSNYGYGLSDEYEDAILLVKNGYFLEVYISLDNKYNNGLFSLLKEGKLDIELNQHRSMATTPTRSNQHILTRLLAHKQTKNVRHNSLI